MATDALDRALAARADARTIERERLRVETEAQLTPEERRAIAAQVAQLIGWLLGLAR